MPAIRPEAISNRIRLTYEFRALIWAFVPEHGTVDSLLAAVINELAPSEYGVCSLCSEQDLFSGSEHFLTLASVRISVAAIMPLIEFNAVKVSILCEPPQRFNVSHLVCYWHGQIIPWVASAELGRLPSYQSWLILLHLCNTFDYGAVEVFI